MWWLLGLLALDGAARDAKQKTKAQQDRYHYLFALLRPILGDEEAGRLAQLNPANEYVTWLLANYRR